MPSNATNRNRDFSPENRPVLNLLIAGLVTLNAGGWLYEMGGASPALVVAGFAATAVGVGPVASSEFGQRVGEWFEAICGVARVALMLALDCYIVYRIADHRLRR